MESASKRARGLGSPTEEGLLAEGDGRGLPSEQRFSSRCSSALNRAASSQERDLRRLPLLQPGAATGQILMPSAPSRETVTWSRDLEQSCSSPAPSSLVWAHDSHGHDALATRPLGDSRPRPLPLQQHEQQQQLLLHQRSLMHQQQHLQLRQQLHQQLHQRPHGLFVESAASRQMAHAALSPPPGLRAALHTAQLRSAFLPRASLCPTAAAAAVAEAGGCGFLSPGPADLLLSQQQQQHHGLLPSLTRLEMSADILRQKEFENMHGQQRLFEGHPHLQPHPHSFAHPLSNQYAHQHTHHLIGGSSVETTRQSALMLLKQRHLQQQLSHRHQPHLLAQELSVSHARGLFLADRTPPQSLGRRGLTRKSTGQKYAACMTQDDAVASEAAMKREPRSLVNNNSNDSDEDGCDGKEQQSDRGDVRCSCDPSDNATAQRDVSSQGGNAADGSRCSETSSQPSAAPPLTSSSPQTSVSLHPSSRPNFPCLPHVTPHCMAPDPANATTNPATAARSGATHPAATSHVLLVPSVAGLSTPLARSPTASLSRHGATSAPLPNTGLPQHAEYVRSDRIAISSPGFPTTLSPLTHTGPARSMKRLGDGTVGDCEPGTTEEDGDVRTWNVDDVCTFIATLPGCAESAQAFRHHAIDGETLPLLTETHLLSTLGLRLGPALKILAQVARKLDGMVCVTDITTAAPVRSIIVTDTTAAAPVDSIASGYESPMTTEPLGQDPLHYPREDSNTNLGSYRAACTLRTSCPTTPYDSSTHKASASGFIDAPSITTSDSTTNSSTLSSPQQLNTQRESDVELTTIA